MPVQTLTPAPIGTEQRSTVRCASCGATLDDRTARATCPNCGGLLAVEHVAPKATGAELRRMFDERLGPASYRGPAAGHSGVWRFRELVLPAARLEEIVSHPEGNTPLVAREAVASFAGVTELRLKHGEVNTAEQGQTANIKQNTTNKGFFKGRRVK